MKSYTVPPISYELVKAANDALVEKKGQGDATVTLVVALGGKYSSDEILAVTYRLQAMQRIVLDGKRPAWTRDLKDKPYKLVNEAMFRAAARTTLKYTSEMQVSDIAFDEAEFLKNALDESDTEGRS
jgi:hypothetical protein